MRHKIAFIGFGKVGQGIGKILLDKKKFLKENYDFEFDLVAVSDLYYGNCFNENGLDLHQMLKEAKNKNKFSKDLTNKDNCTLIKESNADIICELTYTDFETGGLAMEHVFAALSNGKHVICCNKGPAALNYTEFKKLADRNKLLFLNEGTVCSGTPILNLSQGPLAGCKISKIYGVLNGTTNYILSEMEQGYDYNTVLLKAQQAGYLEANLENDVKGYDARGKVAILANMVMGVPLKLEDIPCKGITGITLPYIEETTKANKRLKLIGCVENKNGIISGYVAPEIISKSHPLYNISGTTNALIFSTDLLGDITISGPGAGPIETGFAVLSDLLRIHREAN